MSQESAVKWVFRRRLGLALLVSLMLAGCGRPAEQQARPRTSPVAPSPPLASLSPDINPIPRGQASVTIDGICHGSSEYGDGVRYSFEDAYSYEGEVYFKHDGEFLYACMLGTVGTSADRWISLELAPDSGDASSITRISVYPRDGRTNSTPGATNRVASATPGATNWAASGTTGMNDTAEFRVPAGTASGAQCGTVFRMSMFHYWMSAVGDDYSWPNPPGIGFDQPAIWPRVSLECGEPAGAFGD